MRITKSQLRRIIREEVEGNQQFKDEFQAFSSNPMGDYVLNDVSKTLESMLQDETFLEDYYRKKFNMEHNGESMRTLQALHMFLDYAKGKLGKDRAYARRDAGPGTMY